MASKEIAQDVGTALATALGGGHSWGGTIKEGPKRSGLEAGNAGVVLWVTVTGGRAAEPMLNVSVSGGMRHASVQVLALGAGVNRKSARVLAQAAWEALQTKAPATTGAPYLMCLAQNSEPLLLGQDEDQRWEYASTFELSWIDTN